MFTYIVYTNGVIPESAISQEAIRSLYQDAGWTAYTRDIDTLIQGILSSATVILAYDQDKLVGLIRGISDFHTILYIQDILVLSTYQRKGIGRSLMEKLLKIHQKERQVVLLTDVNEQTKGFYAALGFSVNQNEILSFSLSK
ncbi:MAG: GNAT family N-acetyltransferase [Chitinophagales bacterium]|jgi:ribosomal protein S18 acetylase RimI-like enzyme|nr:GNAT family N-acetyltransferase [Chitinophagales bacterium]